MSEYYLTPAGNPRQVCKACVRKRSLHNYHKNPSQKQERNYWSRVERKYGVSRSFVTDMIDKQDGKCPICDEKFSPDRRPNIDHCHITGRFRGVLCSKCNPALGLLGDDPARLAIAIEYLKRPLPELPTKKRLKRLRKVKR